MIDELLGNLLAHIIFLVLLIAPLQSAKVIRRLDQEVLVNPTARLEFYRVAITSQWLLMPLVLIAVLGQQDVLATLGFKAPTLSAESLATTGLIALVLMTQTPLVPMVRDRMLLSESTRRAIYPMRNLLPRTSQERELWLRVALTAGVCEEILFRGFLMHYAQSVLGFGTYAAVIGTSLVFAVSHYYQGTMNMLRVGVVGVLLAVVYVITDSLLFCIILHALLDLGAINMAEIVAADEPSNPDASNPNESNAHE